MNPELRKWLLVSALALAIYGSGLAVGLRHYPSQRGHSQAAAAPFPIPSVQSNVNEPGIIASDASQSNSAEPELSAFETAPGMKFELFESAFRRLKIPDDYGEWERHLVPLIYGMSADDYPKVWKLLSDLSADEGLKEDTMRLWTQRAPAAALAAALAAPTKEARDNLLYPVIEKWAQTDSAGALAWLDRMSPGTQQNKLRARAIYGLVRSNPSAAAALLDKLPPGPDRGNAAYWVVCDLAATDPDAAVPLLDQVSSFERSQALRAIADARVSRDIPEAVAWAKTLANSDDQGVVWESVVAHLAESDPRQAAEFVTSLPDARLRNQMANKLGSEWAAHDSQAALDWLSQLPEGLFRQQAWKGICSYLAQDNPEAMANFALNTVLPGTNRIAELKGIAESWCVNQEDDQPLAWAARLAPGDDRDAFLSGLCQHLADYNPEEAAQLALSMSPGAERTSVICNLTTALAQSGDAERAIALSTNIPEGKERTPACVMLAIFLAEAKSALAVGWLQSLPADKTRSDAALSYANTASDSQPELAAQCVEYISNDDERRLYIQKILQNWMPRDPEAAQAWLDTLPGADHPKD